MPSAAQKMQAGADKVGKKLAAKGLREYTVTLRQNTVGTAGDPDLGIPPTPGVPVDTPLVPPPVVENVSVGLVVASQGVLQLGDIRVSSISRSTAFATLIDDPATVWRVKGPHLNGEFSIVPGVVRSKTTQAIVTLRLIPGTEGTVT